MGETNEGDTTMIRVTIPVWLARSEKLTQFLEAEVLAESGKAILLKGTTEVGASITCRRCGRDLTHPVSRVVGIGPECCAQLGIARPNLEDAIELAKQLKETCQFERWFPKSRITIEGTYTVPTSRVSTMNRTLWEEAGFLFLQVPYDEKDVAKTIHGYTWNGTKKAWQFTYDVEVIQKAKTIWGDQITILCGEVDTDVLDEETTFPIDPRFPLYAFQQAGVNQLLATPRAILADEPGLGKTIQVIAVCEASNAGHVLVVCPNSLKRNWAREIVKWVPHQTYTIIDGDKATRLTLLTKDTTYTIINYEALRLHTEELSRAWDVIIFDEAHRLKSRDAQVTKAAKVITKKAKRIYELTGTPILNRQSEIWQLLNLLEPKTFSSYWRFVETYCDVYRDGYGFVVNDILDPKHPKVKALRRTLEPMMVRRLKAEVLKDMPRKTIQQVWIDLQGSQRKAYQEMAKRMLAILDTGEEISTSIVLAQITRLKQITVDEHLMSEEATEIDGAKIQVVMDILESLGDKKVVIFSQFERAVSRLDRRLRGEGFKTVVISGQVTGLDRDSAVERFQTDPTCRVCLVTIKAGGEGLTLTAASTAIFLDKDWTPARNTQAQDRLHRIGQEEPVTIIELLASNSVEARIEKMLNDKQRGADLILETESQLRDRSEMIETQRGGRELLRFLLTNDEIA